jgi:hypothetical protein
MPAQLEPLAGVGFEEKNQTVRLREGKRRKYNALGDAVDGGIRTDAERQNCYCDE